MSFTLLPLSGPVIMHVTRFFIVGWSATVGFEASKAKNGSGPEQVVRSVSATYYPAILLAAAGARRGGGVSGIPGHNAARAVLG